MKRDVAVNFLVRKVAKIIYDTVECSFTDRADSDWYQAEKIVRDHFSCFIGRMCGSPIADDFWASGSKSWNMPDDSSYEDFERLLGDVIWHNTQIYRRYLPRPPYGRIMFE